MLNNNNLSNIINLRLKQCSWENKVNKGYMDNEVQILPERETGILKLNEPEELLKRAPLVNQQGPHRQTQMNILTIIISVSLRYYQRSCTASCHLILLSV